MNKTQKSISIAIVGRPNVGKSTLFNKILGKNLSPITHKRQTTQSILNGIKTIDNTQIVIWDTPGIFNQSSKTSQFVKLAWHTLQAVDLVFIMISSVFKHDLLIEKRIIDNLNKTHQSQDLDSQPLSTISNQNTIKPNPNIVICVNKIDLTPNRLHELQNIFQEYTVLPLCALNNTSKDTILNICMQKAKIKPWLYNQQAFTNLTPEFISNEITRKYILLFIHEEIPYHIEVINSSFSENETDIVIHQEILTKHDRYKPIIIGHNAQTIKNINIKTRKELEKLFNKKIHLFIKVKTKK